MCERYSLCHPEEKVSARFGRTLEKDFKKRYNVSPGQRMPVITGHNPGEFSYFSWGLIPNWSLDGKVASGFYNARAELLFSKSHFKQIIHSHRCLVPADGYYDWKKSGKTKIPYRVTLASDEIFAFAGIWDSWEDPQGEIINTYSIITRPSDNTLSEISDRMPVILSRKNENIWIEKKLSEAEISDLIRDTGPVSFCFYKTHKIVNSPEYDLPQCLQAAPKIYPGETYNLFDT